MKSIVSYEERGSGGRSSYRGNCSPRLITDIASFLGINEIADYMCGSNTTKDAAEQLGIESHCYDLNMGFDLMHDDIPERPEAIFFHPPYWSIIGYAGHQYDADAIIKKYGFDPRKNDLSRQQPWEDFLKELNFCILKQFAALEKGGHFAILVGDIKKKGLLYSMLVDMIKPGTLKQIVIKAQHNVWSDNVAYTGQKFIPIAHEYMILLQKDNALIYPIKLTKNSRIDVRDAQSVTWRDVVASVLEEMNGKVSLDALYNAIDGHRRTETNKDWRAKIRQTLQAYPDTFHNVERGVWSLAA